MSITEATAGQALLIEEPVVGVESAEIQMWRITEGRGALTLHLDSEFRVGRDLMRLIGTLEPVVRDRDEIRRILVDASSMPQVPPGLLYTVRVLDRLARAFDTTVDIQPA